MLLVYGYCRFTNIILLSSVRCHTGITLSETKLFKTVYIACTLVLLWYLVWNTRLGRAHSSAIGLIRFQQCRTHRNDSWATMKFSKIVRYTKVFLFYFILILLIIIARNQTSPPLPPPPPWDMHNITISVC